MYEVHANDLEEFARLCAMFVREGVGFTADASCLLITLTGAY